MHDRPLCDNPANRGQCSLPLLCDMLMTKIRQSAFDSTQMVAVSHESVTDKSQIPDQAAC